jgi:thiol-disulfide isomerase/thioredoxin
MNDPNWWKQAKGTKANNADHFQELVDAVAVDKLIVVDFFMPNCGYCVKFMPEWNRIVDDFTAKYGDAIQFLKVDGIAERYISQRYNVQSYPTFILIEGGTNGDSFHAWRANHRTYDGMKQWIEGFVT